VELVEVPRRFDMFFFGGGVGGFDRWCVANGRVGRVGACFVFVLDSRK
jgi:hypothetical protein